MANKSVKSKSTIKATKKITTKLKKSSRSSKPILNNKEANKKILKSTSKPKVHKTKIKGSKTDQRTVNSKTNKIKLAKKERGAKKLKITSENKIKSNTNKSKPRAMTIKKVSAKSKNNLPESINITHPKEIKTIENKYSPSKRKANKEEHEYNLTTDSTVHLNINEIKSTQNSDLSIGPSKFSPYNIDQAEEYMNEQQLQHFTNILNAWKQELMEEVDHTITEMKEADLPADPNDRATQEETFNLELRARDRERKLIKKIESALTKIDEQKYGYCDSCGIEIGIRRLEARPTATLCIECKTLAEIREKRF